MFFTGWSAVAIILRDEARILIEAMYRFPNCIHFAFFSLVLFCNPVKAQDPDKRGTLEFINQQLAPAVTVDLDQGTLFAEFRDSTGQIIRKDRVEIPDFGEVIEFEYESGLLCIPCSRYIPGCVTRELIPQKVRRGYDRFSIPLDSQEEYEPLRRAFDHLFKILTIGGYRETVVFN